MAPYFRNWILASFFMNTAIIQHVKANQVVQVIQLICCGVHAYFTFDHAAPCHRLLLAIVTLLFFWLNYWHI